MKLFIDTSAILAFLNANDDFHEKAVRIWNTILNPEHLLFCNNYILIETYSILQRRFGMEVVHTFYHQVIPVFEVLWITQDIHKRAMSAFLAANRRNLSFVDCTGFETMRSNGISSVFTFDHHYLEQSFEVIPAMD